MRVAGCESLTVSDHRSGSGASNPANCFYFSCPLGRKRRAAHASGGECEGACRSLVWFRDSESFRRTTIGGPGSARGSPLEPPPNRGLYRFSVRLSNERSAMRSDADGFQRCCCRDRLRALLAGLCKALVRLGALRVARRVDHEATASDPAERGLIHKRVTLPREERIVLEPPSASAVSAIVARSPRKWRLAIQTLAGTGMRVGELHALQWRDVDQGGISVPSPRREDHRRAAMGRRAQRVDGDDRRDCPAGRSHA